MLMTYYGTGAGNPVPESGETEQEGSAAMISHA